MSAEVRDGRDETDGKALQRGAIGPDGRRECTHASPLRGHGAPRARPGGERAPAGTDLATRGSCRKRSQCAPATRPHICSAQKLGWRTGRPVEQRVHRVKAQLSAKDRSPLLGRHNLPIPVGRPAGLDPPNASKSALSSRWVALTLGVIACGRRRPARRHCGIGRLPPVSQADHRGTRAVPPRGKLDHGTEPKNRTQALGSHGKGLCPLEGVAPVKTPPDK